MRVGINHKENKMKHSNVNVAYIQEVMIDTFAMPEREQAAEWDMVIDFMDGVISAQPMASYQYYEAVNTREVFVQTSREVKHFV